MIELHNVDCMEYLATLEDNAFDLAIVDPPYGIGMASGAGETKGNGRKKLYFYQKKNWDDVRPSAFFFNELRRVSVNQIIWGGNYFADLLQPSRGWIYWRKLLGGSYSDGELAYTSFDKILNEFTKQPQRDGKRIHPTQKPVKLYEWLLMNYANEGDRILDTHLGSGSIAIACHNLGFDLVGCELDTDYFNAAKKRLQQHQSQLRIPMQ